MAKELEGWITKLEDKKQRTIGELQKMKEDYAATFERLEKEMAELREK